MVRVHAGGQVQRDGFRLMLVHVPEQIAPVAHGYVERARALQPPLPLGNEAPDFF